MEDGLPSQTAIRLNRNKAYVYDLLGQRQLTTRQEGDDLKVKLSLAPCDGRLLMVTERPLRAVTIKAPQTAARGQSATIEIAVTDGSQPLDAVVPIEVRIQDPEGNESEFSGYYGAASGTQAVKLDFARNDRLGVWQIHVKELASGRTADAYLRLQSP